MKLSEKDKARIARRYRDGEPLKVIGGDFGLRADAVSSIARARGVQPRNVHKAQPLVVRLSGQSFDALRSHARSQHSSPEVIAREAIAAYLGLVR